jgi:serine phosphatase RsbU (regulator of sigma subunit)
LRDAAPHELLHAARAALRQHFGATAVDLLMADYAMKALKSVGAVPYAAETISTHAGAPGRAFGGQQAVVQSTESPPTATAHLPVTIRGDRLGVLSVTFPAEAYAPELLGELQRIAEALGHEILVADRDTDLYLVARRAERLTLAAEMQWQLLPGRACSRPEYHLGAQLEPAYDIRGDNFDWSASADHLDMTVTNGMGEGIDAALLTNLAVNAIRNARRADLDLVGQTTLADQAVYGQYGGAAYMSVLLLRFHLATGAVEVVDAGSPRIWRLRAGEVAAIELEAQLPLGMFEDTLYAVQHLRVAPGDRLLFVSDGVYDATSLQGDRYGEQALVRAMKDSRLLPPSQVPGAVLRELTAYRSDTQPEDDALVVCLDWHGREVTGRTMCETGRLQGD